MPLNLRHPWDAALGPTKQAAAPCGPNQKESMCTTVFHHHPDQSPLQFWEMQWLGKCTDTMTAHEPFGNFISPILYAVTLTVSLLNCHIEGFSLIVEVLLVLMKPVRKGFYDLNDIILTILRRPLRIMLYSRLIRRHTIIQQASNTASQSKETLTFSFKENMCDNKGLCVLFLCTCVYACVWMPCLWWMQLIIPL